MSRSRQWALIASLVLLLEDVSGGPWVCYDVALAAAAIEEVQREGRYGR
jgi:hypothetical protein